MKKVSLLAASVAIALTGCGGSDSGSGSNGNVAPGGVIVTGFDGYFNNAVVFADTNNNGAFDVNTDQILGLTAPLKGKDGQLEIKTAEFNAIKEKQTRLGLQTLVPGGDVQTALIAKDPSLYAGKYTIDMDHPTQAMAHEVALFTLPGEKVISPLTDLVVVQAGANPTEEKIAEAKEKVNETLGISGDTAFSDVIAAQNHALHKTAQILTESKVKAEQNSGTYDAETALIIAQEANTIVSDANNADKLDDPSFKPTVEVENGEAIVTINNKLSVNSAVEAQIRTSLSKAQESHIIALDIHTSAKINGETANLFADKDTNDITVKVEVIDYDTNKVILSFVGENGATIHVDGDLTQGGTLEERLSYMVKVSANDLDSKKNIVGNAAAIFNLKVDIPNSAPVVDQSIAKTMQEWIGSIELFAGVELTEQEEMSIDGLFTDADDDNLTYTAKTSVKGLNTLIINHQGQNRLRVEGKAEQVYAAGETITVEAFDGKVRTAVAFELAAVEKAPVPSFNVNLAKLADLQSEINTQLADMKVGQALPQVQLTVTLADIFTAENTSGAVEYYVGLAGDGQEYMTSIPGVRASAEQGILTISGTPTAASQGGEFFIQAGINPDSNDGLLSEMMRIALPAVAAVTPPPPANKLAFTKEHFNNQVWRMGSFADRDGEIAYASLMTNAQGDLEWCWGDNHGQYSSNISHYNGNNPFAVLRDLDNKTDYLESQAKDCWAVTINTDGTLVDADNQPYDMLYQHSPAAGEYQILVKIGTQELFWMDSTNTPLAQVLPVAPKLAAGNVEFDLSVESGAFNPELDGPELSYAMGSYTFKVNNRFVNESIKPTGFYTTGSWEQTYDSNNDVRAELTEEMEDQKTRVRYINREFGDFYIAVTWSEDQGGTSAPQYSLFGYDQDIMTSVFSELPIMK
ncbi:hypothetical protein [Vibrio vulnificus]|uniref:hypothetical protein n=1 Tax=Vibrio vulnificus TaxID=672 RepID=UPI0009B5F2D1|nr:hypothetical protein [Vibrio vulnificus]OQK57891.1 hypothetical protein XM76_c10043 [Vibrio vulnificus]